MANATNLDNLPREIIALAPTPVHPLQRLQALLAETYPCPNLLIKRDDLNGIGFGGNKLRKLEYLLGDARQQGCDTLITAGAAQSNHCRQTAAVGAMYNLETHLCLRGPEPERLTGNLLLDEMLGAELHFAPVGESVAERIAPLAEELKAEGKRPYTIPIGGSNAVGSVGYVTALQELNAQGVVPDYIVVATGSGGTQAGMEIGVRLLNLPTRILGIGVAHADGVSWNEDVAQIANAVAERVGFAQTLRPEEIECPLDYLGPKYGEETTESLSARFLLAQIEGIFLDPVYSAKAMGGLIDRIQKGGFRPTDTVLFWHTGGAPSLFAL